jgi:alpha-amylase
MQGKYAVSEYFDVDFAKLSNYVRRSGTKVFDFPLFFKLKEMANDRDGSFDMRNLIGASYAARDPYNAVTFVENHDTDMSQPIVTDKMMAYAYIMFTEGSPTVFLKDYWQYGLKTQIDPLIAIRRTLLAGKTTTLHADNNLLVLQRDGWDGQPGGVLVLNNHSQETRSAWVSVKPEWAGQDLVDHTGNQMSRPVQQDGRVELSAGPRGYAIYSIKVPGFDAKSANFAPQAVNATADSRAVERDGRDATNINTTGVLGALAEEDKGILERIEAKTTIGAEDGR